MGLKLVVAEKPSVCNDIARVIGATDKKKGFLIGNGYIVTHCVGHLVELAEPEAYGYEGKWKDNFDALPIFPDRYKTVVKPEVKVQFELIKKLMDNPRVDEIIVATDAGREGQYIYGLVAEKAGNKKPEKRLWISSMTDESIKKGMLDLKDNRKYQDLYASASCRAKADWEVGINFTRLYTVLSNILLSIGRVQTPTLNLIVERHRAILDFKPEPFYEVEIQADGLPAKWFKNSVSRFESMDRAKVIADKVRGKKAVIKEISKKEKKSDRPALYSLNELQKDGNKKYGYTAAQVLQSAQNLYEKYKVTTYPRTDSRCLTDDMEILLPVRLKEIAMLDTYKLYAEKILADGLNIDKNLINNEKVSDHHAIIPTEKIAGFDIGQLNQKDKDILHLIVTRFLVTLSPKMVYDEIQAVLDAEGETFRTGCKIVKEAGYTAVQDALNKGEKQEKKEEKVVRGEQLLGMKEGSVLTIQKADVLSKKTTPPKEYTDASIIAAMENPSARMTDEKVKEKVKGFELGTVATRASIIDTLINREFIKRERNVLIPTELGMMLIDTVPESLKSPELTAEWEQKLAMVGDGSYSESQFMREIKNFVEELTKEIKGKGIDTSRIQGAQKSAMVVGKCPACGGSVLVKHTKDKKVIYGCENYKSDNTGCGFSLFKEDNFVKKVTGKTLSESNVKAVLEKRKFKTKGLRKDGSGTYDVYLCMEYKEGKVNWSTKFPDKKPKKK